MPDVERVVGYLPRLDVAAGELLPVHASGDGGAVTADLVRLDVGDAQTPVGAQLRVPEVGPAPVNRGSWASVRLPWPGDAVTVSWWMRRTLRDAAPTPVVGVATGANRGWVLEVAADDAWGLRARDGAGNERVVPLAPGVTRLETWVHVVLVVTAHEVRLRVGEHERGAPAPPELAAPGAETTHRWALARSPWDDDTGPTTYDGRMAGLQLRWSDADPRTSLPDAAWAFDQAMHAAQVPPATPDTPPLTLHQAPTRAVTGPRWTGAVHHWTQDASQWDALHFHRDDLEDAGWPVVAKLDVPVDAPPGVYAVRLRGDTSTDVVPFVVRAGPAARRAPVRVLLPTMTYLAYADEQVFDPHVPRHRGWWDDCAEQWGLLSAYNWHADGSGVSLVSIRRPLLGVRPDHVYWLTGAPHGLPVDLILVRWLRRRGHDIEVITDHQLDRTPDDALAGGRVLVTGSHPEYWTRRMTTALEAFLAGGGRLAYLGGNGLAAQVGVHPERPYLMELRRRGNGPGLWDADPGELGLATTGEQGGYWRHHRPTPRSLTGLDSAGMGFVPGTTYRRTDRLADPALDWVLEGVRGPTFGSASTVLGTAAAYEVDRADPRGGTPGDTHVLASATGFPPEYVGLDQTGEVRADLVLRLPEQGGAVFGVGSVSWCGALEVDDDVARVTDTVLRRFADPTPLARPRPGAPSA